MKGNYRSASDVLLELKIFLGYGLQLTSQSFILYLQFIDVAAAAAAAALLSGYLFRLRPHGGEWRRLLQTIPCT